MKGSAQTSRDAYHAMQAVGANARRQHEVLEALKSHGVMTCNEISRYLGLDANQVTGRLSELEDLKLIERKGLKKSSISQRLNQGWGIKE